MAAESIYYPFHLIYQSSAPAALLDEPAVVVDSDPFSESPGPVARAEFHLGETQPIVQEVPDIGSGWYTDLPPAPPRVRYFESTTAFLDDVVVVVGDLVFTESPGPTLRVSAPDSRTDADLTDVPPIGSGWFSNPPPVILRPFVAMPGEPPGDEFEPVAIEDVFSEGPYLLLRRPFHESSSESQLADVQPIGSGWFTNPPPVILRPGYFLNVAEPTVEPVPEIGSGWYMDAPPIVFRPGYYPSTTVLPFDIPGVPFRELCPPLVATLIHQGNLTVVEITNGILKADEVESTIAGFAFLVHQGNLVAEEIIDGTLKVEEC